MYDCFPEAWDLAEATSHDRWYRNLVDAYYKERIKQVMMDIVWANINGTKKIVVKDIGEYVADHFSDLGYTVRKIEEDTYFISWDLCD